MLTKLDVKKIIIPFLQEGARKKQHFTFSIGELITLVWQNQAEEYRRQQEWRLPNSVHNFIKEFVWDLVAERIVTPTGKSGMNPSDLHFFVSDDNRHKLSL